MGQKQCKRKYPRRQQPPVQHVVTEAEQKEKSQEVTKQWENPAEVTNGEGETAVRDQNYELAIQKFDQALNSANEGTLANTIRNNKTDALIAFAKKLFKEALSLEADDTKDNSQEAQSRFEKAKSLLQQAQQISYDDVAQKNLNVVIAKIQGNQLFNDATILEEKAFALFENARLSKRFDDYSDARKKYKEALDKYEAAKKQFQIGVEIGSKSFEESVRIIDEQIVQVKKVIEDIRTLGLSDTITKTTVEKKDEKKQNDDGGQVAVNTNVHRQIDH